MKCHVVKWSGLIFAFRAGLHALSPVGEVVPVSTTAAVLEGMTALSSEVIEEFPHFAVTVAPVQRAQAVVGKNKL